MMRRELVELSREINRLQEREKLLTSELERIAEENESCRRLLKVPGVGPLSATAFIAAIGDPSSFKNGREASAWLGLVPKQFTTGGRVKLGRITKKGDSYLRQLLIHGARSVLAWAKRREAKDKVSRRMLRITEGQGFKKAAVALANRNTRVMLSMLKYKTEYGANISA